MSDQDEIKALRELVIERNRWIDVLEYTIKLCIEGLTVPPDLLQAAKIGSPIADWNEQNRLFWDRLMADLDQKHRGGV